MQSLLTVNKQITIEMWFKAQKNTVLRSYLLMVEKLNSREERIRFDVNFSSYESFHSVGAGSFDSVGSGYMVFESSVNENFWYHILW